MKKFLFALPAGLLCFCISCNNKSADNSASDKNIASVHGINKAIESGDVSNLGDYITTDAVDHAGMPGGDVKGLDSIKAELSKMHGMMKDMKMDIVKEVADSEYVFEWIHSTGTALTNEMGMTAGQKMDMNAIEVSKMKDGKATEHWEFMQPSDMMKMMPPPPMPQALTGAPDSSAMHQ